MRNASTYLVFLLGCTLAGCGAGGQPSTSTSSTAAAAPESEPTAGPAHIALTAAQIEAADIGLVRAGPGRLRETLPLYGVIVPNGERLREVAARYPGVIRSVNRKLGDAVRQGETLATVESNESLQSYAVTAPLAGVVTERNANVGEQTGAKPLFVVADLDTVWVELALFPRDAAKVHVGQGARIESPDSGHAADGKVTYVAPFGSSASQTLTARVLLDNAQRRWAPGLYVTARIILSEREVPLAVRSSALQRLHDTPTVFVRDAGGFEVRTIRPGRSDGELTEVLDGVRAGETYAAANSFVLKAEAQKSEAAE